MSGIRTGRFAALALGAMLAAGCGGYTQAGLRLGPPVPPTPAAQVQIFAEGDPGRPVEVLAVVLGTGDITDGPQAAAEAMRNVREAAAQFGADAVVGLSAEIHQSQFTVTGVAVRFR